MSATNCSSSTAIGAAAAQSPTAAADASNIVPPQRKSSNIDATILGVAASPLKPTIAAGVSADEDRPLKIVSRENSPVVAQPQTPIILVDPQPKPKNDAASNPLRKSSPPPPPPFQQRQTPAVAPPQPQPTFISQPTPVMGGTTAVPPPQPHGFLIGSPHNNNNIAAAASMPYGFFAAAAAAAAQQQHAAILLNSCPPLTFVAPPQPAAATHRISPPLSQQQTPRPPPPQLNFPPTSILFCRMPGAPMPNVGFGPYTGAAYHDPTIMPNWNGHFLVRTATGQLMALAVNNTPNLSAAHHQTVQRTTPLTQTSTNFLPPLNNNNETPRNQPPVNKTTTTTTTSIFPNRPPTATPILQKTLILPSKDQTKIDAPQPQPQPIIIGCGPPAMYRPPSTSTLTSAESKITSGVKRRRQTTTSNVGVKKPRRVAAASTGLLIAAPKALPPTPVTPALPPAINFKDKKVKEEIHDMFVDQIRNDCTLMFDAPQIMTHFIDGFVIQESLDPFPISPLIFDDLPPFIQQSAAAAAAAGLNFDWAAPPRLTPEFAASSSASASASTTAPPTSSSVRSTATSSAASTTSAAAAAAANDRESPSATTVGVSKTSAKNLLSPTISTSEKRCRPLISPKKEASSPVKSPTENVAALGAATSSACRGCSKKLPSTENASAADASVVGWYRKNADFCSKACYKSTKKRRTSTSGGKKKRRRDGKTTPMMPPPPSSSVVVRPVSVPSDSQSPQRRYSTETPLSAIVQQQQQQHSSDFPSTSSSTTFNNNNLSPGGAVSGSTTLFLEKSPVYWTVDDVQNWLINLDQKFCDLTHIFRQQEIDGQALLLLQEDHLAHQMGLKLGPVLKISAALKMLRN